MFSFISVKQTFDCFCDFNLVLLRLNTWNVFYCYIWCHIIIIVMGTCGFIGSLPVSCWVLVFHSILKLTSNFIQSFSNRGVNTPRLRVGSVSWETLVPAALCFRAVTLNLSYMLLSHADWTRCVSIHPPRFLQRVGGGLVNDISASALEEILSCTDRGGKGNLALRLNSV